MPEPPERLENLFIPLREFQFDLSKGKLSVAHRQILREEMLFLSGFCSGGIGKRIKEKELEESGQQVRKAAELLAGNANKSFPLFLELRRSLGNLAAKIRRRRFFRRFCRTFHTSL